MRIIKLGLISIVVFSLLITFLTLFFPSRVKISRAIDINSSKEQVELFIRDPEKRKMMGKSILKMIALGCAKIALKLALVITHRARDWL